MIIILFFSAGVFDFIERTWSLWTNNPRTNPPIVKFPLKFNTFVSSTAVDRKSIEERPFFSKIMSDISDYYALSKNSFLNLLN